MTPEERIRVLEGALLEQYLVAHSSRCEHEWPHDGRCFYPPPDVLPVPPTDVPPRPEG